jgi:hypothetical protein
LASYLPGAWDHTRLRVSSLYTQTDTYMYMHKHRPTHRHTCVRCMNTHAHTCINTDACRPAHTHMNTGLIRIYQVQGIIHAFGCPACTHRQTHTCTCINTDSYRHTHIPTCVRCMNTHAHTCINTDACRPAHTYMNTGLIRIYQVQGIIHASRCLHA